MPLAPEEVLKALVEATAEAKATMRQLHEERKASLDLMKQQRKEIETAILTEVERVVSVLSADALDEMQREAKAVIARLEQDWRAKLGLT